MNRIQQKRFEALITYTAAANKKAFDMVQYAHHCGSPSCILGNYVANYKGQRTFRLKIYDGAWTLALPNGRFINYYNTEVKNHFGITFDDTEELFSSEGCGGAKTPAQAVKYLKAFYKKRLKELKE